MFYENKQKNVHKTIHFLIPLRYCDLGDDIIAFIAYINKNILFVSFFT